MHGFACDCAHTRGCDCKKPFAIESCSLHQRSSSSSNMHGALIAIAIVIAIALTLAVSVAKVPAGHGRHRGPVPTNRTHPLLKRKQCGVSSLLRVARARAPQTRENDLAATMKTELTAILIFQRRRDQPLVHPLRPLRTHHAHN